MLYVDEETSIRRQMERAKVAKLHNKRVMDAGAGELWCAGVVLLAQGYGQGQGAPACTGREGWPGPVVLAHVLCQHLCGCPFVACREQRATDLSVEKCKKRYDIFKTHYGGSQDLGCLRQPGILARAWPGHGLGVIRLPDAGLSPVLFSTSQHGSYAEHLPPMRRCDHAPQAVLPLPLD